MTEEEQRRILDEEIFRRKVQDAIKAVQTSEQGWRARTWQFLNSEIVKGLLLSTVAIGLTAWIHSHEVKQQEVKQAEEKRIQEEKAKAEKERQQASLDIEREIRYVTTFIGYVDKTDAKLDLSMGLLTHLVELKQVSEGMKALFQAIIMKYSANPSPSPAEKSIVQQAVRAVDLSVLKQTQAVKLDDRTDIAPQAVPPKEASEELCKRRREAISPTRVYIHYTTKGQEDAEKVRSALDEACFLVPGIENITGKANPPKKTEVRLFTNSSNVVAEATQVRAIVNQGLGRDVALKFVNPTWTREKIPPRLFEVWLGTED
jgi:hypothetical protein